jgi:hypothetical protein
MSPVIESEIKTRYSGGAANTSASLSLGGAMSTAAGGVFASNVANNLFDDVSASEAGSGDTEYRCFYVENSNAAAKTLESAVIWIDAQPSSASTECDIGLDPAAIGSNSTTTIADEDTAPTGVTFSRPTTKDSALAIGNIPAGSKQAVWICRTVSAGAAAASDSASIRVEGDTVA